MKINRFLAAHLTAVQKEKYKPSHKWVAGDSIIENGSHETVVLTKEQADKLNAADLQYFLDNCDIYTAQRINQWIGKTTLISSKTNSSDYLKDIAHALSRLTDRLGKLIILGDWNTPWLHQKNNHAQVQKATQYLMQRIDEHFNGGFVLGVAEITEFIPHLFWLTRCNASVPEFMMSFESSETIFTLCKYGVLHLEFYNTMEREEILKLFSEMGFKEVDHCKDAVVFD